MKVELSPDSHEVTLKDLELFFPSYSYLHEFILSINQKEALEEGIFTDLSVPLMVVTASPYILHFMLRLAQEQYGPLFVGPACTVTPGGYSLFPCSVGILLVF